MALARNSEEMATLVADYLLSHPDFLNDNPDILSRLNLTHSPGKNISSLIELQVERLRESHRYQQQRIDFLHQASEQEQGLTCRVLSSALEMMNAENLAGAYQSLQRTCQKLFSVDELNIFVFTDRDPAGKHGNIYFENRDSGMQRMFIELFNRDKPLCDSLQQEYLQILFGGGEEIHSSLLIPHTESGYVLLFAFGSHRRNAYRQGFELKLIGFLKDIFMIRFADWIAV
ncbi:MAG: DUF484 family protein [Gammaproteobacteria bacterium]|nr:DUF484 family protein [Gammaproteobacteria bacterium]